MDRPVVCGTRADSRLNNSVGISLRYDSQFLDRLGVERSHEAIHQWVHKATLQPSSKVTGYQLAFDPQTNEIRHVNLFPTANKQTTRWFLAEIYRRYQFDDVVFLVDDADYLRPVLAEDGY